MQERIIAWLVSAMMAWVPVPTGRDVQLETVRYTSIAADAFSVTAAAPTIFDGDADKSKRDAALLLLAIGSYESHYEPKVDSGEMRGDHGRSYCFNQVMFPTPYMRVAVRNGEWKWVAATEPDAWSGEDLIRDRQKCFAVSLAMVRTSLKRCGNLSGYTSGRCDATEPKAIERRGRATRWAQAHPFQTEQ